MAACFCIRMRSGRSSETEIPGTPFDNEKMHVNCQDFSSPVRLTVKWTNRVVILLPAVLRDFAAIGKEVVLVGVLNRVEIWSKERWLGENEYEDMDEAAEHMAALGLSI